MPTIDEVPIAVALDVLKPTFRSLDLRAVAVEQDGRWIVAVGVLSAKQLPPDQIAGEHVRLRASAPRSHPRVRLLLDTRSASDLDVLLDDLDAGVFAIGDQRLGLAHGDYPPWAPIRSQRMKGNPRPRIELEDNKFKRYAYSLPAPAERPDPFAAAGVSESDLQLRSWRDWNLWLGLEAFGQDGQRHIAVELLFPIYVWIHPIPTRAGESISVVGQSHGALQADLTLRGAIRSQSGELKYPATVAPGPPATPDGMNDFILAMPFDPLLFDGGDLVEVRTYHPRLGDLDITAQEHNTYFRGRDDDPLRRAVLLFDAGARLQGYLSNVHQGSGPPLAPFEAGAAWLLGMLLPRCVPLFADRQGEPLRHEGVDVGSADLIGHHPELGLVVVDCTRGVPQPDKAERLRATAIFLYGRLGVPVRAVILAPGSLPILQKDWRSTV